MNFADYCRAYGLDYATAIRRALLLTVLLGFANTASAQLSIPEQLYYPGSLWSSTGKTRPVEKGNVIHNTHLEQGIAWRGLEGFVDGTFQSDSQGLDWNNSQAAGAGARFTLAVPKGFIRGMVGYGKEYRRISGSSAAGARLALELWIGWAQSPPSR